MVILLLACSSAVDEDVADSGGDTGASWSDTAGDSVGDSTDTADTGQDPADVAWEALEAGRDDALRALGEPIVACVTAPDTPHAAFHGCYDWHSAVHGHWALLVISRLLDEPVWASVVDASLTPDAVASELDSLERGELGEIPYGYAWFLALARERALSGADDLEPHAAVVADALEAWITPREAGDPAVFADDYDNYSWALYNLWAWSVASGDTARAARAEALAVDVLAATECPLTDEIGSAENFFPACLMRAHALAVVLPDALLAELPDDYPLAPVTDIRSAHQGGLNFSRSWGLWSIYARTGETRWRDLYVEHVAWHLAHPEYWAEDYDQFSHWVPQFGVYALALIVDDPVE